MHSSLLGDGFELVRRGNRYAREKTGEVFLDDVGRGNLLLMLAVTRFGKSVLGKIIYTQVQDYRPLLLFDYSGEHMKSMLPNFRSKNLIRSIPDLEIVSHFGFHLTDFCHLEDFSCLGFPDYAAQKMSEFCSNFKIHHNKLSELTEFLVDLPTQDEFVGDFNSRWSDVLGRRELNTAIPYDTKRAMLGRVDMLESLIADPSGEGAGYEYVDFRKLVRKNRHVLVNTGLNVAVSPFKAQVLIGKILENLMPLVVETDYNPFIFIDEADKLAPVWPSIQTQPTSLKWLLEFSIKFMKYDVFLALATQDPNLLHPAIVGNRLMALMGQLPENAPSDLRDMTRSLRWSREKNYREFVFKKTGEAKPIRFVPTSSPCMMW